MPIHYAQLFIFRMTPGEAHNSIANAKRRGRTGLRLPCCLKTTAVREPCQSGPGRGGSPAGLSDCARFQRGALLILRNML